MYHRPLGHTELSVSALCLGAMYFGTRNDEASSFALLDQFVAAGGDFIDTANIYAHWAPGGAGGESELLLGRWFKARGNRQSIVLASKVGFAYPGIEIGLRAKQIEEECNKSLRRMDVETIDLFYAHVDDRTTPLEESMAAFDRLVAAGKVRHLGASNYLAWRLERANWIADVNGWTPFCCIQQRHTYLRPKPGAGFSPQIAANSDLLDHCANTGVTLLAYSALLSGAYTRPERPIDAGYAGPDTDVRLATLQAVAAECGATANQVILAWMMQGQPSVLPLVAASTKAQLQENIDALQVQLSVEQMERLTNARA
jgi:aryl-alcohol dehydrogenase-like predicted oxidoreductase